MDKIVGIGNALVDVLVLMDDDKMLEDLHLPKGSMQLIDKKHYLKYEKERLGRSCIGQPEGLLPIRYVHLQNWKLRQDSSEKWGEMSLVDSSSRH